MSSPTKVSSFAVQRGSPKPLGTSYFEQQINFALYSEHATTVTLNLFSPNSSTPLATYSLDPTAHRTGDIWHIEISDVPDGTEYTYQVDGPTGPLHHFSSENHLLDPYAKQLATRSRWADASSTYAPRAVIRRPRDFDWQGVLPPRVPWSDLLIYELHTRSFTQHVSSGVKHPGTYLGLIEKIPYLQKLGVNAVELMPIHEFNELEYPKCSPETGEQLVNSWGYSTVNFFSPMARYAATTQIVDEFRTMVRAFHRAGIEVILDVVFNHTAEGDHRGPSLSFRGIDNSNYYMLDTEGRYLNYSGCGNTLNSNEPAVRNLILDSLQYWATEMHVDGFRFDLASILGRDKDGTPLAFSPLIDAISRDPILADCKLIAEAWDAGGLYQVGDFFPEYERWAEWNGAYRDVVRQFIKGTDNQASQFATRMSGSEDLYGNCRLPYHSVNLITAHDGFTLNDLVSYNDKHNEANAEDNQDGDNHNNSWNCGEEGPSDDSDVLRLREKQKRNHIIALMTAQGTPMLRMGDEYGHSQQGNNNTWCQDNELTWFDWEKLEQGTESAALYRFVQKVIHFRKTHPQLHQNHFLDEHHVQWYNAFGQTHDWNDVSRFVSWVLHGESDLYIAFNAGYEDVEVTLPSPSGDGDKWSRVIDSSLPSPDDFSEDGECYKGTDKYMMAAYSAILFKAVNRL